MKILITSALSILLISFISYTGIDDEYTKVQTQKLDTCYFKGKKLYGKIQLVEFESQADIKVQIVNSFPDLRVKFVESFPDKCGEWQIVEFNGNLKVYITKNAPDIKIKAVGSFPGLP